MPSRAHPMSQVKLYAPQRRVSLKYDGFGQNDLLADLYQRGELAVSAAEGYQWPDLIRGAQVPGAMMIEAGGLNTMIARPLLDLAQPIGLGHFSPITGKWTALPGLGLGSQVRLYQYDGAPNQTTGIQSNFSLPTNPIFAVSLYRAHVAHDHDWNSPPYTEVHFSVGSAGGCGAHEWALAIPYGEPMLLLRHDGGRWAKVADSDRGLHVPSLSGMARGQSALLWIGVIRNHIAISTDGFVNQVWAYRLPTDEAVASGKVSLWHNAGQWAFAFCPIAMYGCDIQGPPMSAGYDTGDCAGPTFLAYRHLPVINDRFEILHGVQVEDNTGQMPDLPPDRRTWKATLTPNQFTQYEVGTDPDSGEPVDFSTCLSPQLHSVQIGQWPELTVGPEPDSEDLSDRLISLAAGQRLGTAAAHCRLIFDNHDGALADLPEYRRMEVSLGWCMDDESQALVPLMSGYSAEPQVHIAPGGRGRLQVELLDPMVRLRDEKCDGRAPVFDGWPVRQVCQWVLGRCGLDESEMLLEDTGRALSIGSPEQPLWQVEPGRPWVEFLAQVAAFDHNAALFFDPEGRFVKACGHCRQPRSAEDVLAHDGTGSGVCDCTVSWDLYTRPDAAPDHTAPGEILRLERLAESLATADYRNYIMVAGADAQGRPVRAVAYDAASVHDPDSPRHVGWRKMEVYEVAGVSSQAEANALAAELLEQLSPSPEHVALVTPLEAGLRVGQVLRVHGGERAGVDGGMYRIVRVEHRVHRAPRRLAYSSVQARAVEAGHV